MQTSHNLNSNSRADLKRTFIRTFGLLILLLGLAGCSTIPTQEKLNKIDAGMTKRQVISKLGEPTKKGIFMGRDVFLYMVDENGDKKPHIVTFEDNGVNFSGSPQDYKAQISQDRADAKASGDTQNTVSPVITVSPTINYQAPEQVQPVPLAPQPVYQRAPVKDDDDGGSSGDIQQAVLGFYQMQRAATTYIPPTPYQVPVQNPYQPAPNPYDSTSGYFHK